MMPRIRYASIRALSIGLFLAVTAAAGWAQQAAVPAGDPRRFESAIAAFLKADQTNPPPKRAILFIGSSIFRLWTKLPEQMAPLPVFNRAFGGSRTADILHYMEQVVLPYEPQVIVYYCGSNDVNANIPAATIAGNFRAFVTRVHAKLPNTRILYVSINRAPQKQDHWDVVDAANRQVQAECAKDERLTFIDVNPALFDAQGQPRMELYLEDKLHFREPAYEEFTRIVKPVVAATWAQVNAGKKR